MMQIRLCWRPDVVHHEDRPNPCAGEWMDANFEGRRHMKIILESALEVYGPGSHWVEKRDVPDVLPGNQNYEG